MKITNVGSVANEKIRFVDEKSFESFWSSPFVGMLALCTLMVLSPSSIANEWATGELYHSEYESYQFAPDLKSIPREQLDSSQKLIDEKGSLVIVSDTQTPQSLPESSAPSTQVKDCGYCQILWNTRTGQYAVLFPIVIISPKDTDITAITQELDQISDINYKEARLFIEVKIENMKKWFSIMRRLNRLKSLVNFIEPQIIEDFVVAE